MDRVRRFLLLGLPMLFVAGCMLVGPGASIDGWAIGDREAHGDEPAQDWNDSSPFFSFT